MHWRICSWVVTMVSYGDPWLAPAGFCADGEAFGERQETRVSMHRDGSQDACVA